MKLIKKLSDENAQRGDEAVGRRRKRMEHKEGFN
jgi:hypothetical protein